jgi:glycosyltransferase involved in cell wall biosynthesis
MQLVSVLMTSFNRELLIRQAIDSVINSTYKNFELIIVDDCSSDRTVEIARSYEAKDNRVRVFVNDFNLGDYPNRNRAASFARGKYIKYVDADDYIYPNGLEILVSQMEKFPQASVGLFSLQQNPKMPFPILLNPRQAYEYNFFGLGLFHKAPLSAIFRADAFHAVGGFMPDRMTSDFEMWHRMAQNFNFLLIQDHIVWYREHDSQEANSISQFELKYTRIERNYLLDQKSPLTNDERDLILLKRFKLHLKLAVICLLKINFSNLNTNLRKMAIYKGWIS